MNKNSPSPENTNPYPAPDFPRRLECYPGPDDRPWWRLWMSGYSVPSVYTAWRAGIISTCENTACDIEDIEKSCGISHRAARVLLNNLASLGLLEVQNQCYRATPVTGEWFGYNSGGSEWHAWLDDQYEYPITPDRLYQYITGGDVAFPRSPAEPGPIGARLVSLPWGFPAAVVADRLGLPAVLGEATGQPLDIETVHIRLAETDEIELARLRQLLDHLAMAGVVNGGPEHGYSLSHNFGDFLNQASCYYKGGTLRLMEMAPPCAEQSWNALIQEQASAESRMDETIKSPDLDETYAFALHMDAQGAGADAVLARSGLISAGDRVLDLAGGAGSYSITSAIHSPETRFFLLEQKPMTEIAQRWIAQHGVEQSVEVIAGNMFELSSLDRFVGDIRPDTIFASNIFHDWGPEKNLALAREVYAVLPQAGRFILHEMPLAEDGYSNDIAAGFSETLRIWTEGMQYKLSELEQILKQAGFGRVETTDGLGPYKFVTGIK